MLEDREAYLINAVIMIHHTKSSHRSSYNRYINQYTILYTKHKTRYHSISINKCHRSFDMTFLPVQITGDKELDSLID